MILPKPQTQTALVSFDPKNPEQVLQRRKESLAAMLANSAAQHIEQCRARHKTVTDLVWDNKQGLTPQQAFDALGVDAARSCQLHAAFTQYLKTAEQILGFSFGLTEPKAPLQMNEDGTVTVL